LRKRDHGPISIELKNVRVEMEELRHLGEGLFGDAKITLSRISSYDKQSNAQFGLQGSFHWKRGAPFRERAMVSEIAAISDFAIGVFDDVYSLAIYFLWNE
jgi:hypothetical protein